MTTTHFRFLMVLTVVFAFLGGAGINLLLRGSPARAQATQDLVRARGFEMMDDQGRRMGEIGMDNKGYPNLWLYDSSGKTRAGLGYGGDDSGLWLNDASGTNGVQLGFGSETHQAAVWLSDKSGKTRVQMGIGQDGNAHAWVFKEDGSTAWSQP